MEWWFHLPPLMWCLWVFVLGLGVGSFLNVLIARLPFEKSIVWPNSRCFTCLQPIRFWDNLPILGWLRLRGKCRRCGASFSSRYLWVEIGTGFVFLLLFVVDCLSQATDGPGGLSPWHHTPGLKFSYVATNALPPAAVCMTWAIHACLASLLIAAAVIDAKHQIIPTQITYTGTLIGIVASTLFPWPWPTTDVANLAKIPVTLAWILPEAIEKLPTGVMVWPFWGPTPSWAPLGSWQLGLSSSLIGAAFGMLMVRAVKFLFEVGMGRDALGLGDADLLMMAGAFLGWQVVLIGFFAGAFAGLLLKIPTMLLETMNQREVNREFAFGPGLALGIGITWFAWPWINNGARVLFEPVALGILGIAMGGGLLIAGILLRRK